MAQAGKGRPDGRLEESTKKAKRKQKGTLPFIPQMRKRVASPLFPIVPIVPHCSTIVPPIVPLFSLFYCSPHCSHPHCSHCSPPLFPIVPIVPVALPDSRRFNRDALTTFTENRKD